MTELIAAADKESCPISLQAGVEDLRSGVK